MWVFQYLVLLFLLGVVRGRIKGKHPKEQTGVVLLDAVTFYKVVPQTQRSVLLLVHNEGSEGDYGSDSIRQDFYSFAEKSQLQGNSDMILYAQVLVSPQDPANVQVAIKLGMSHDFKFPKIFFFPESGNEPIEYPSKNAVNHIALSRWITKQVDNYFLPTAGLIEAMGPLVTKFTKTKDKVIHASIIEEANALAPKVELKDKENIQSYIKFMQRISERGFPWIKTEILRLEDLITGEKISKHNQILLQRKVNILHIFDRDYVHDEL